MTAKDIDCSYCGAKAGGPCVRYDGYTREPHVIREQEASFRAWQNAAESLPAALEQKCEQCGEPLGSGHHVDGLCYAGGEVNKWLPVAEPVAPVEAKPFYENSECADCDGKLYGKKAFWVPTTGKTPGKKLICETCANAAESLLPEPAQEMKVDGAQIWVGSREWVRREEEKKMQVALQKMREIKPVEPLSVEAKEKEQCECGHSAALHEWHDDISSCCLGKIRDSNSWGMYPRECTCPGFRPTTAAEPKPTPSEPESKTHDLKVWPEYYRAIIEGRKFFEIRKNDRDYKVGDLLTLREYNPEGNGSYTGYYTTVEVSYVLYGGSWGLPDDMCVMSIVKPGQVGSTSRKPLEDFGYQPQPDSSSVSTEQTFEEWYGNSYPVYQECATRNVTRYGIDPVEARQHKEAASNAWAAAKGQR